MTIEIEEEITVDLPFDYELVARQVIEKALDHEDFPFEAEVHLTITDNEEIASINKEFRGIDRPTDVLSFPMIEYTRPGDFSHLEEMGLDVFHPETGEAILGDIILSQDKVKEQAIAYGHSPLREYAFLILHSMLHLFGYDHMTEEDAAFMEYKQNEILKEMNILR